MSSKVISFNKKVHPDRKELRRLKDEGYMIICPFCSSEIIFNGSEIRCSKNPRHYYSFGSKKKSQELQDSLERDRKQRSIDNMKKKGYSKERIQAGVTGTFTTLCSIVNIIM